MESNLSPRPKLGTLLEKAKAISIQQLIRALDMHKSAGLRLGEYLVRYQYITEDQLARALAEQFNLPFVDLTTLSIDTFYAKMVPRHYAMRHHVVPITHSSSTLTVAVADPADRKVLQELKTMTGLPISPVVATSSGIVEAIERVFKQ